MSDRSGPETPEAQMLLRAGDLLRLGFVLDAIDPKDQVYRLLRDRRRRQRLVKVAPQVRMACPAPCEREPTR